MQFSKRAKLHCELLRSVFLIVFNTLYKGLVLFVNDTLKNRRSVF